MIYHQVILKCWMVESKDVNHNSVSYLPAGIGTGTTPNNQENLNTGDIING